MPAAKNLLDLHLAASKAAQDSLNIPASPTTAYDVESLMREAFDAGGNDHADYPEFMNMFHERRDQFAKLATQITPGIKALNAAKLTQPAAAKTASS